MTADALAKRHARAFQNDMRPWTAEEFSNLLASPHSHLIQSDHAFALIRVVADEAELLTLATDPDHRRQGLARTVLEALETRARQAGAVTIFLEVSEANTPARALYASAGYHETARRPDYYKTPTGQRIDALILTKSLS
ncbi:MAG: ribosomal protein S18-alanine N-acetyltransferase [Pseudomonadota bacterium]